MVSLQKTWMCFGLAPTNKKQGRPEPPWVALDLALPAVKGTHVGPQHWWIGTLAGLGIRSLVGFLAGVLVLTESVKGSMTQNQQSKNWKKNWLQLTILGSVFQYCHIWGKDGLNHFPSLLVKVACFFVTKKLVGNTAQHKHAHHQTLQARWVWKGSIQTWKLNNLNAGNRMKPCKKVPESKSETIWGGWYVWFVCQRVCLHKAPNPQTQHAFLLNFTISLTKQRDLFQFRDLTYHSTGSKSNLHTW